MASIEAVEQAMNNLVETINSSENQSLIFDASVMAGSIVEVLRNNIASIKASVANKEIPLQKVNYLLQRLEDYHILLTKYFVRVAVRYNALVEKVDEFAGLPENQEGFTAESRKNLIRIKYMKKHWKDYELIDTQACDAAEEFGRNVQKIITNFNNLINCLLFAMELEKFVRSKEGIFSGLNALLQEQRTVDIPRIVQMSQSLIEKRQLIFVD